MAKSKKTLKKKLKKKVNPEKSNKMIIAVTVGLVILFAVLFVVMTRSDVATNKEELMTNTMKYLKKGEGVIDVKLLHDQNKVVIIYDDNVDKEKNDFKKVARFACLKLSNKFGKEKVYVVLVNNKNLQHKEEFTVVAKDGRIIGVSE